MIPLNDRDGWIWIDGEMKPWREAGVHVLTHGLHYGSCVFEGERSYDGNIFKIQEHSERLIKSAKLLDMPMEATAKLLDDAKKEALEANNIHDGGYIRNVAWRGSEQMGISAQETKTHIAVACWKWGSYFDPEKRDKGITLRTVDWRKPPPDCAPTESKAAGLYMINTMSKHACERAGYDDALMLDYRGYVAESSGANFFMIQDGVLKTPIPDCFLNGITRQTVISIAENLSIPVEETRIKPEDLKNAQEIFVTGTAAEVTAVGKIDDLEFSVGPITKQLREAYEETVRKPDAQQGKAA